MRRHHVRTLILFLAALPLFAAGTVTSTLTKLADADTYVITITATADSNDASFPTHTLPRSGTNIRETDGFSIISVVTDPGATAPTDNYDITITNAAGLDLMNGQCANRDTANTESCAADPVPLSGATTLNITNNSVNSATITIYIFLTRQTVAKRGGSGGGGIASVTVNAPASGSEVVKTATGSSFDQRGIVGGTGLICTEGTNDITCAPDTAVIPYWEAGAGAPSSNCTAGQKIYLDTTNIRFYRCSATNTWTEVARISSGSGAPAAGACDAAAEAGTIYYRTDDTSGAGGHYGCAQTGSGTYGWVLLSGSGAVTASSTDTFTNKTLDVEGTGNSITVTSKVWLLAAGCQNATASLLWDTPTSNPAVAACVTGTNTQKGVADFADGANALSMQQTLLLPSDWTGAIDAKFKWFSATTSGDVVWQIATSCVADAETDDPAFNTASTVTDTAKGTTNQTNDATITGVTATGCAAGELLHIKVTRDPAHASDNHAATARLIGVELTLRRAM